MGANHWTRSAETVAVKLASHPSMNSSITIRLGSRTSSRLTAASASRLSLVTVVPLPAASPSALITHGGPRSSRALFALFLSMKVSQCGVGRAYLVQRSFAKLFEVSIRAASLSGPNIGSFFFLNVSTIPAPNGASGPKQRVLLQSKILTCHTGEAHFALLEPDSLAQSFDIIVAETIDADLVPNLRVQFWNRQYVAINLGRQ